MALQVYKNLHLPVPHKFPMVEANYFSPSCINGELQAKCIPKTRERIMKPAAFSPFNLRQLSPLSPTRSLIPDIFPFLL